jgi:hypothetical protein
VTRIPPALAADARVPRVARRPRHLAIDAAVVLASLPILVATGHRVANGWQPASDDAAIARLAHDVFSTRSPLVGMPSTINQHVSPLPHHWGPMLFWFLAIPDRIFASSPIGLLFAVALLNIASLVGIAVFVNRRLGTGAATWMLAVLGLVFFSLGQEVISSIWNPDIAVLPLALFIVLVWSVACGDTIALPWMVVAGSFVVQAHLLYTPLVVALGAFSVVWLLPHVVGHDRCGGRFVRLRRGTRHLRRHVVTALAVAEVCWSTALYQQVTAHPGNISQVLDSYNKSRATPIGVWPALHLVVRTFSFPPLWAVRHSSGGYVGLYRSPSLFTDAVALFVLLAPCVIVFRRGADRQARTLVVTLLVTTVASLITVADLPLNFVTANPYRVRFVWLTGAFAWFVLGTVAVSSVRRPRVEQLRPALAASVAFILLFGAIAGSTSRTPAYADLITDQHSTTISALSRQLRARLSRRQPYLIQGVILDDVEYGVMWDLVRHSFDIRVDRHDPYLGTAHAPPPGQTISTVFVIPHALPPPKPSGRLIASTRPTAATRQRLARQEANLCAALRRDPPTLTRTGRALLRRVGRHPQVFSEGGQLALYRGVASLLAAFAEGGTPPCTAVRNESLPVLLHLQAITTAALTESQVVSYQDARSLADTTTYDVYRGTFFDQPALNARLLTLGKVSTIPGLSAPTLRLGEAPPILVPAPGAPGPCNQPNRTQFLGSASERFATDGLTAYVAEILRDFPDSRTAAKWMIAEQALVNACPSYTTGNQGAPQNAGTPAIPEAGAAPNFTHDVEYIPPPSASGPGPAPSVTHYSDALVGNYVIEVVTYGAPPPNAPNIPAVAAAARDKVQGRTRR